HLAIRASGAWHEWADTVGFTVTTTRGCTLAWTGSTSAVLLYTAEPGARIASRTVTNADGSSTPTSAAGTNFLRQADNAAVTYRFPRLVALSTDYPGFLLTYVEHDGTTPRLMAAFGRRADWFLCPFEIATMAPAPVAGGIVLRTSDRWW